MTQFQEINDTQNKEVQSLHNENVEDSLNSTVKQKPKAPNPECTPKKSSTRRRFTSETKLNILKELDACKSSVETRSILHREGIYTRQINKWRAERVAGTLCKDASKALAQLSEVTERYSLMEEKLKQTQFRLKQAETIIEAQKKIASVFFPEMKPEPTGDMNSFKRLAN